MKLDEIARLAGVSRTTASYVINGKAAQYRISQATQDKVMAVVKTHNYQPDRQAAALRGALSHTFGLIVPDLENPSYARLAKLLEWQARQAGFQLLITCSDDRKDTEKDLALMLKGRRVDALLVASCLTPDDDFYLLLNRDLPVIGVDRALPDPLVYVSSENSASAFRLTRTLAGPELEQAWLVTAAPELGVSREREQGFTRALAASGVPCRVLYGERFERQTAFDLLSALDQIDWQRPQAIVTTAFVLLEGVLDYFYRLDARLPERLKLGTFGDHRLLDFLSSPVNTIAQDHQRVSQQLLSLTLGAVRGHYRSGHYPIPRILHDRRGQG
ncbi:LacI family fructose operon transcriptional repressor [Oceanisphaera litoralis]|uniref:catabolite repressor/activator n=1 Tax=Oceanisphaera litoralis TaxID=225144 RepID=UPI001958F5A2|nr:catabolite repressor/activator [Oceanisphaera litoralis]MBM7455613.1 LacI family fructose operon transcriptional repressor [Oceanisphaera litoralis]